MAPIHLYLAAWVLGGVLLGASMLLDAREPEAPDAPRNGPDAELAEGALGSAGKVVGAGAHVPRMAAFFRPCGPFARYLRVLPLGLIGFGLSGLLAKGLDVDHGPWTFLFALTVGAALIALGYRLSRARSVEPSTPS
jgi:hypothetical protein